MDIIFKITLYISSEDSNVNSQLDATITNFIDNYNQLDMFRAIVSPILRSTRLCFSLWYNAPTMFPADDKDEAPSYSCHLQAASPAALYHKL